MDNGKYIVLNEHNIIIFDATMSHKDIADYFTERGNEVTSAGFIVTDVDNDNEVRVQCYGKSVTLGGLPSDPENDSRLAKFAIGKY